MPRPPGASFLSPLIAAADRAVLTERATALARRTTEVSRGEALDLVSFSAAAEVFAIEAMFVREVVRLRQLSSLPGAPPAVRGVTTYQGEILAVVDLLSLLGIDAPRLSDALWLLVLGRNVPEFGITADELHGSVLLGTEALLRPTAAQRASPFISAMTADAVAIIDGGALLASDAIFRMSVGRPEAARDGSDDHEKENSR